MLTEGGNNASTEFSGVIKDDGPTGLTKSGAGTLTLSGTNTYTGPTDVNAGVLEVAGSIARRACPRGERGDEHFRRGRGYDCQFGWRLAPGSSMKVLRLWRSIPARPIRFRSIR